MLDPKGAVCRCQGHYDKAPPLPPSPPSPFCLALVLGAAFKLYSMKSVVFRVVAGMGCMNCAYKKLLNSLLLTLYVGREDVFVCDVLIVFVT